MAFWVNRSARTIHQTDDRGRSLEQCNLDEARRLHHLRAADPRDLDTLQTEQGYKLCSHCFPPARTRAGQAARTALDPTSPFSPTTGAQVEALERAPTEATPEPGPEPESEPEPEK